jgi:tRNA (uracil-5-)-methyltransferase
MEPESNPVAPLIEADVSDVKMDEPKQDQEHPGAGEPPQESTPEDTGAADPSSMEPRSTIDQPVLPETENRNAWDHSDRRVHVQGVDKYATRKELMKLATKWSLDMKPSVPVEVLKIKKPPNDTWMVIHLADPAMAKLLADYINNNQLMNKKKNRTLTARLLSEMHIDKRPPPDDMDESRLSKRQKHAHLEGIHQPGWNNSASTAILHRPVSEEEIKNKIIPLWKLSLEEQLQTKTKLMINQCALKIHKELKKKFRDLQKHKQHAKQNVPKMQLYQWLLSDRAISIDQVVSLPNAVRNKCEFTFGWRYSYVDQDDKIDDCSPGDDAKVPPDTGNVAPEDGGDPTKNNETDTEVGDLPETKERPIHRTPAAGMMAAGWAGGVSRPHCCENISSEACAVVDIVDEFLSTSPLPPYNTISHTGVWRLLTVRTSRATRECMVIVTHCPATGGAGEDGQEYAPHFESEMARLLSMLITAKLPVPGQEPIQITSVFFQAFDGLSAPSSDTPVQHLHGKTHLLEQLGKCSFQISPGAFFQVNSVGAEMLYATVVEKVKAVTESSAAKTLLFDVCCGTGTIGLCCMKEGAVDQVIGIDISEPAIQDAQANAVLNGFTSDKVRFVAGRAEDVMSQEIAKARRESEDCQFVAVVDPAREGLHPDVVRVLRMTQKISRIVYVSCNPTGSLVNDLVLFCSPPSKRYTGRPFKITSATPYDMFPLTNHCEMVMVLDRMSVEEFELETNGKPAASAKEPESASSLPIV